MPSHPTTPQKRVSKSTLSMFLRTRCDKELFLSLHEKKSMGAVGFPDPVKRPGIGLLSEQGKQFEVARNDQLVRLFPGLVKFSKGTSNYNDIDLETQLKNITSAPFLLLQAKYSIAPYKTQVLENLGLNKAIIPLVPDIADFIPDVLVIRPSRSNDSEINPDGTRRSIDPSTDRRFAIDVFDIKHTGEANPSYCSEIAMYAIMLANWIDHHPDLKPRYFVSMNAFLWTRIHQGNSTLVQLEATGGASVDQLLDALVSDSEDANLRYYLASVGRFFENVIRVIQVEMAGSWNDLDWHVRGSCGSCDWLGDKRHLSKTDKAKVDANPTHYCIPAAAAAGHLCLVPGITQGAKKILNQYSLTSTADLASATGHPALQLHTFLKRDAKNLPLRSTAILSGTISTDPNVRIASLVKSANLLLYVGVNFDSSSGLLTGLSLSGVATAFTRGQPPRRFPAMPYVVDQKNLDAEWIALEAFLSQIAHCINITETIVPRNPTGQIHFWEKRQFKELCNAMGRHLPKVLSLTERKAKAMAWVFASEDLIATPNSLTASIVVTVEDIVRRAVFTPTPHVISLFDTSENYSAGHIHTIRDSYYREYLSNAIPRERMYEIWSNADPIKRGPITIPRSTIIHEYSKAIEKQTMALESVCQRLRQDYPRQFKASSTRIPVSIPQGAAGVAFDSKLWIWWDSLEFNTSQLESHLRLSLEGDILEANYEAIILLNGSQMPSGNIEYDVAASSLEAKFKEGSNFTLGKINRPGMPLERATGILPDPAPAFRGDPATLQTPLWSALQAKLIRFDRANAKAEIELSNYHDPLFAPYMVMNSTVDLLNDVFLVEPKKPRLFDWSLVSKDILGEFGNPPIATPDQNAANAMGLRPRLRRGGTSSIKPGAKVLWDAIALEHHSVVTGSEAKTITANIASFNKLNSSQISAVEHAIERGLTIIWGPPGTGKTKTVAAIIHALVLDANMNGKPLKLLVSGTTYKAVEEVMHQTAEQLSKDPSSQCSMIMAYSNGRAFGSMPQAIPSHFSYTQASLVSGNPEYTNCLAKILDLSSIVIVGCQIRQAKRFPKDLLGSYVQPVFDVAIIDESSQVTVSQSLAALCGLKPNSRLVIAGDHFQMPPITSLDPPAEAAYLVGSIQTYLLERNFSGPVNRCELQENYRSSADLVSFARRIGYPNTLHAHYPKTALHFLNAIPKQSAYPTSLPWCNVFDDILAPENSAVATLHEDDVSSQGNEYEARIVAGLIWMLRSLVSNALDGRVTTTHVTPTKEEFWDICVGVVTPHRAQRALVIRELCKIFPGEELLIEEAVDTVERFQGGQRHTIIVTFGVADTDVIAGEEAFLMQMERTNVAISRAMAKCIVLMPKTLANHIPEDKKALNTAFALKEYVEEFCNKRKTGSFTDNGNTRAAEVRYHK